MSDAASLEALLRVLVLALPALVLILLFFLLHSNMRARTVPAPDADREMSADARTSLQNPPADAVAEPVVVDVATLEAHLAEAESKGDVPALVRAYLAVGRARRAMGMESDGLEALRSAAGLAARHGLAREHALSRLELADAALNAGDPITACEHWQMARMAFLDAGMKADGDRIDHRMRANGCPTDWVLTDF